MSLLVAAIPLAPLAAALAGPALGDRRARLAAWLPAVATAVSLACLLALAGRPAAVQQTWLAAGRLRLHAALALDELSWFMAMVVAGAALAVHVYAAGRAPDHGSARFFAWMSFFTGAMLALVLAGSLLLLYAAWEAVGVASWALIGFHHRDAAARRAARNAFLMTRVGDMGLLLGWLWAASALGTDEIAAFLDAVRAGRFEPGVLAALALLFLAGAAGKSAQLPFTGWLPGAMAGPTPVSALIHSSTMVAAGVYLVLRLYPLFQASPAALAAVLWVGAATALAAALAATVQNDLKRVLAWSTASQIGEMMMALGLLAPLAAAYHLAAHAAFKAALFLAAGAVQHAAGTRDLRRLGALGRSMPRTAVLFGIAALALAGVPPLSGFWSEERVLAGAAAAGPGWGALMLALLFLAGLYIGRAGFAVFAVWPGAPAPAARDVRGPVLVGAGALAAAAAVLGAVLHARIDRLLPFGPEAGTPGWPWRAGAIAAALAGLAAAWLLVRARGPVPAWSVLHLDAAVEGVAAWGARAARPLAAAALRVERAFDAAPRGAARAAMAAAAFAGAAEDRFDAGARAVARAAAAAAGAAGTAESRAFSAGLDRFALWIGEAGNRVRAVESGKLYLYTRNLVAWTLAGAALLAIFSL